MDSVPQPWWRDEWNEITDHDPGHDNVQARRQDNQVHVGVINKREGYEREEGS